MLKMLNGKRNLKENYVWVVHVLLLKYTGVRRKNTLPQKHQPTKEVSHELE